MDEDEAEAANQNLVRSELHVQVVYRLTTHGRRIADGANQDRVPQNEWKHRCRQRLRCHFLAIQTSSTEMKGDSSTSKDFRRPPE
nr:hypothetical protein CFP56_02902 [Quercus suber]